MDLIEDNNVEVVSPLPCYPVTAITSLQTQNLQDFRSYSVTSDRKYFTKPARTSINETRKYSAFQLQATSGNAAEIC